MKRALKLVSLILAVSLFALMAMGSGSDEENENTVSPKGENKVEISENKEETEAKWEAGEPGVTLWTDSIGTRWIQVVVPVTNTGSSDLYFESAGIDLEDENGSLVDTMSMVSFYPQVLKPGETGVYVEETTLDGFGGNTIKAIAHVKAEKATVECIRYPVSDLSIVDEQYGEISVKGRIENPTAEEVSGPEIAVLLYDENNSIIGRLFTYADSIAPGDKIGFSAGALSLPDDIKASSVARYEVFAYPYQYQFSF